MRSVFIAAATRATSTAVPAAAAAASGVRSTAEANPQVPSTTTRTASPLSSASDRALQLAVGEPDELPANPLDAEVGVLRAKLPRLAERGVGERRERQARELRVDPCVAIIHPMKISPQGQYARTGAR